MAKRETAPPEITWDASDEDDDGDDSSSELQSEPEFQAGPANQHTRPGFHLLAARRIEEALERRQLRKAIEDFDDYDV
ncbi:MAG: hypothetical protein R3F24_11040 [Gammaproteobacteria bacterium]